MQQVWGPLCIEYLCGNSFECHSFHFKAFAVGEPLSFASSKESIQSKKVQEALSKAVGWPAG